MINVPVDVIGWSLCSLESNSKTISSACVHVIKTHSSFLGSSSFGLALKLNFGRAADTEKCSQFMFVASERSPRKTRKILAHTSL